jgi:hypothetical protein
MLILGQPLYKSALQPPVVNYTLVFYNTPLGVASGYPIGFSREIKQVLTHSRQGPLRIASASWGLTGTIRS